VLSGELEGAFRLDKAAGFLRNRPWTNFENFVYREQKIPMALDTREALEDARKGAAYQSKVCRSFGHLEESPLPIYVLRLPESTTSSYIGTASNFMQERAKQIYEPALRENGLAVLVYYYPYVPDRVRFQGAFGLRDQDPPSIEPLNNLLKTVARLLLLDMLPFGRQDFGIGQCVAAQNVTTRGGLCDVGSIVLDCRDLEPREVQENLRAMGVVLTRTAVEMLVGPENERFFEFENPSTVSYQLSGFIHARLKHFVTELSSTGGIEPGKAISLFLSNSDESIKTSLGW